MALATKLQLRQAQQLVMTPQLQQAIRLLQLSNLELGTFLEGELERNPLLERAETGDADPVAPEEEPSVGASGHEVALAEAAAVLDTEVDNVFPDLSAAEVAETGASSSGWASLRPRSSAEGFDEGHNLEAYAGEQPTLKEHLARQLNLAVADPVDRLIGAGLIDLVDDAGYLPKDLDPVAERLGAPMDRIARVLNALQSLEPAGVCARSLAECLALQLKDRNRYDPLIAKLLERLDLIAARDLTGLRRALGVDAEELGDMIAELKRLNPKPGLQFGPVQVHAVVPDVMVRHAPDGGWHIELNADTLPRVLVDRSYYARVSNKARGKDKGYLSECLQNANWLVKSLDQRARTILRVTQEIVRQQDAFLTHGVEHLRPLNLKTVAEAIAMHESTVSRVTSNKYAATPRGVFELKYFFTSALASANGDGESHSSEAVRFRIRQLIGAETAQSVLSDDMIVDRLKSAGIDIARRTVAKYRESMRIPSSVERRRERRLDPSGSLAAEGRDVH